jgi:Putative abortive phage resistance protein AbiGi, antitoxin
VAISTNSIVHFTKSKDALKGILFEGFKIKHCREVFPRERIPYEYYVPMVSFCDIPFSFLGNHIDNYGGYGIGLTREWAVRNRMNPVLYLQKGSYLAEAYFRALTYFISGDFAERLDVDGFKAAAELFEILRYSKPFEGPLERSNGERVDRYRFSDEREWRFSPFPEDGSINMYSVAEYENEEVQAKARESLASVRLEFEPEDVKYIIVDKDDEIHEFIEHLDRTFGAVHSKRTVELLTTRILTANQIRTDF